MFRDCHNIIRSLRTYSYLSLTFPFFRIGASISEVLASLGGILWKLLSTCHEKFMNFSEVLISLKSSVVAIDSWLQSLGTLSLLRTNKNLFHIAEYNLRCFRFWRERFILIFYTTYLFKYNNIDLQLKKKYELM